MLKFLELSMSLKRAPPLAMEIFELPLLSNKPPTLKVKFVIALKLALLSTVRFPAILTILPPAVRLPLLMMTSFLIVKGF